jgi:hypothetical protein
VDSNLDKFEESEFFYSFLFKNRSSGFRNPIRRISQNRNLVLLKSWFGMRVSRPLVTNCIQLNFSQNEHPFIYDMSLNQIVSTNLFQEGLNLMITPFHDYPRWRKGLIMNEFPGI